MMGVSGLGSSSVQLGVFHVDLPMVTSRLVRVGR